ncbi:MAG: histidinol-phosphate transaminase [Buchnera aphidicola (Meitanaphis elongallis)]
MNIKKLVRKNIWKLIPYQSARKIGGKGNIWLNANECPYSDYIKLDNIILNRYPECQPENLLSCYSSYVGVSKKNILITRGSDEAIELLIKTFCEPKCDKIIFCPPTYDMYHVSANVIGVESNAIPLLNLSWQLDIDSIIKHVNDFKLIYICNPNNPTGNLISTQDIVTLLKITLGKALVIIDEAYIEFSPISSLVHLINLYPNLIILRTLSKAFSLAGLRCGFVLANVNIIEVLLKVINPYPVSIPTTDIAIQFLSKKNVNIMRNRVFNLNLNRCWLVSQLQLLNECVDYIFSSVANYILVRFYNSKEVFNALLERGIIVRDQNDKLNLKNCIRISVGTSKECLEIVHVIRKINHFFVN